MAQEDFRTTLDGQRMIYWGSAAQTAGGPYNIGDLVLNTAPAAAGVLGWTCITAGSPGTWKAVGPIEGPYTLATISSDVGTIAALTATSVTATSVTADAATLTALNSGCTVSTVTAAAALPIGSGVVLVSMSAGTCTLAAAASHSAGFEMLVKNIASGSLTLATVAGATYNDAAAVTLAQHGSVVLVGDGTTWYKKA